MGVDWPRTGALQPPLFETNDVSPLSGELFPAVWKAAEALVSPEVKDRKQAIATIRELNAARFSPMVAYLLATKICEPNLDLRCEVLALLGQTLAPDEKKLRAPSDVRQYLAAYLAQMRTRHLYAILQAVADDTSLTDAAVRILSQCPYAGKQLADLMSSRKVPISIRCQAVRLVGKVGFLDTISALERLETRIVGRLSGQKAMPFAPKESKEEKLLISEIRAALAALRAP